MTRLRRTTRRAHVSFQNFSLFCDQRDAPAFETALQLYECLDTPISLSVYLQLKYGEWRDLAEKRIFPIDYRDAWSFADDYQAVSYLRKYPFLPSGIDKQQVALDEFQRTERACKETNARLRAVWTGRLDESHPAAITILEMAREKMSDILGPLRWDPIAEGFGWGPGATSVAKGAWTSAYNKYQLPLDVTSNNATLGLCCINSMPTWASIHSGQKLEGEDLRRPVSVLPTQLNVVTGGRIALVPKDATTDRAIIVPVHVNSYVQRGFGRYMRKRLKRVGIDLDNQSFNQAHAQRGSVLGDRATVDIRSASNTISLNLVRHLLSDEWFEALLRCREPAVQLPDGSWQQLEMFSAMGNGYTFELESAIFFALTFASLEYKRNNVYPTAINDWTGRKFPDTVSVYGDDIIAPSDCFELLKEVYAFCGFEMNTKKSYSSGAFRESCGKDYFNGILVRPVFLKERIDNERSVIKAANSIRRYARSRNLGYGCDIRLEPVYRCLTSRLSNFFRNVKIPEGLGDGGLVSNFDEATPPRAKRGWDLFKVRMIADFPVKENCHQGDAALLYHLTGRPELPRKGQYDLRGRTRERVISTYVQTWEDIGPWF